MVTDTCTYCERDKGLRIFLNRYILCSGLDNKSELQDLYNLSREKEILLEVIDNSDEGFNQSTILNPSNSSSSSNSDNPVKLETIELEADLSDNRFYKNIYGNKHINGYGFKGSVLRKGYVYVYIEHMSQRGWQEYEVSESGFLKRINPLNFFYTNSVLKSDYNNKKEPCSNIQHKANALTIVIPRAEEATKVYFKYSEVQWSKKTREYYRVNYEKTMNVFDVQSYLNGAEQQGVFPMAAGVNGFCVDRNSFIETDLIDEEKQYLEINSVIGNVSKSIHDLKSPLSYLSGQDLQTVINEIDIDNAGPDDISQKKLNDLSTTLESGRSLGSNIMGSNIVQEKSPSILSESSKEELEAALSDGKKLRMLFGALVTIDDPVGIVMDIGSNIAEVLASDSSYTDLEKTANTLEILKSNFGINDDPYYNIDEIQDQIRAKELNAKYNPYGAIVSESIEEKRDAGKTEAQLLNEEIVRKQLQQKRKLEEWNTKYIQHINRHQLNESLKTLTQKKKQQAEIADELDQMGFEFISKSYLSDHFSTNFEKNNVINSLVLGECVNYILESVKIGPHMNKFMGEYLYNTEDKNNYFLNFLSLNTEELRAKTNGKVNQLAASNLNGAIATQPFGDLINSYASYLSTINNEETKLTLLSNIAKAFLNVTGLQAIHNLKIQPIAPLMISLFTLSEIEYDRIKFESLSEFTTKMRLYYSSHFNLTGQQNKIGSYIKESEWKQLYKLFEKQKYIDIPRLIVNEELLRKLPAGLRSAINKHAELLKSKHNEVRVPVIAPDAIEENATPEYLRFFVMKVGIVGLQYWAYKTTFNNTSLEGAEKKLRRNAATVGLSMSIVEAFGALLSSSSKMKTGSSILKSLNTFIFELTTDNKRIIKGWIWRGLGLFAGLIFGGFDVYNGWNYSKNGEKKYGRLLMLSGGLVIFGSFLMFALSPLGWIALLAGIVFSLIAYFIKENDIQLWVRKCLLSTDQSIKRFQTIELQTKGLRLVYR